MSRVYEFSACRVTGGNAVFPDTIIIDKSKKEVIYRKSKVIGCHKIIVPFSSLGCITIDKHVLFADVIIETNGGKRIVAKGFTRDDAEEIARIIYK